MCFFAFYAYKLLVQLLYLVLDACSALLLRVVYLTQSIHDEVLQRRSAGRSVVVDSNVFKTPSRGTSVLLGKNDGL